MILGVINGGLGLQLGNAPKSFIIIYSAVASIVAMLYTAGTVFQGLRKTPSNTK
jgi:hypothetical protein